MFLSDSPTQYQDVFLHYDLTRIHFGTSRRRDLQRLSILSWYFPEEIRILFQLNLKEHWDQTDKFCVEKEILLSTKEFCLAWCLWESGWTENDFFGNVLNRKEVNDCLSKIWFHKVSKSFVKKYTGYCRGYRESNTGAPRSFSPEYEVWVEDESVYVNRVLGYHNKVNLLLQRLMLKLRLMVT